MDLKITRHKECLNLVLELLNKLTNDGCSAAGSPAFSSKAVCCNACLFGKYAGVMEPLTKQLLAKDVEASNVKRVTNNLLHRLLFHRKNGLIKQSIFEEVRLILERDDLEMPRSGKIVPHESFES